MRGGKYTQEAVTGGEVWTFGFGYCPVWSAAKVKRDWLWIPQWGMFSPEGLSSQSPGCSPAQEQLQPPSACTFTPTWVKCVPPPSWWQRSLMKSNAFQCFVLFSHAGMIPSDSWLVMYSTLQSRCKMDEIWQTSSYLALSADVTLFLWAFICHGAEFCHALWTVYITLHPIDRVYLLHRPFLSLLLKYKRLKNQTVSQ